jgi:shikimate kinase
VDPTNLVVARVAGPVVWLRASVSTVVRRVGRAAGRPLLAGRDGRPLQGEALAARVRSLLAAREPFYAQADLAVDADTEADVTAREIAEGLAAWRR